MKTEVQHQIVVKVNGEVKLVDGITKITSCADVINILAVQLGRLDFVQHSFAMFESNGSTQRQLSAKTKILKVIRGWGSEVEGHYLNLREVNAKSSSKPSKIAVLMHKLAQLKGKRKSDNNQQSVYQLSSIPVSLQRNRKEVMVNMNLNHSKDARSYNKCISVDQTPHTTHNTLRRDDCEMLTDFRRFCCLVSHTEEEAGGGPHEETRDDNEILPVPQSVTSISDTLNEACFIDQKQGKKEILKRFFASHTFFHKSGSKSTPGHNEHQAEILDFTKIISVSMNVSDDDSGATDLDEAFVDEEIDSECDDCDADDDMNMCQFEDDIIDIIMNASFCISESDEGLSSLGSDE